MTPRSPTTLQNYLAEAGMGGSAAQQKACLLVLQAVQVLLDAGWDRAGAETCIRRMAFGTHRAPAGLSEEKP